MSEPLDYIDEEKEPELVVSLRGKLANAGSVIAELRRQIEALQEKNKALARPPALDEAEKRAKVADAAKIDRLEKELRKFTIERDAYRGLLLEAFTNHD